MRIERWREREREREREIYIYIHPYTQRRIDGWEDGYIDGIDR